MKFTNALVAACLFAGGFYAYSQSYISDIWNDGTRTDPASPTYSEFGTDADLDLNLESAWYGNSGSLSSAVGMMTGATTTSSRQWLTHFTPTTPLSLANIGDAIKISLTFIPTTVSANGNRNMRFGLFNYSGGTRLTGDATPSGANVTGYSAFVNFAPTFGTANPLQLNERSNLASTDLQGATGDYSLLSSGGANGGTGFASGSTYRLDFIVTRMGATTVSNSVTFYDSLNAVLVSTAAVDATGTLAFDTFSMRAATTLTTAATFGFTQFRVDYIVASVPEPSALVLVAMGLLALKLPRRR
jgi:hypothetical protein